MAAQVLHIALWTQKRFQAKWMPVRAKKTRKDRKLEPFPIRSNRIGKGYGAPSVEAKNFRISPRYWSDLAAAAWKWFSPRSSRNSLCSVAAANISRDSEGGVNESLAPPTIKTGPL